jgi:segregation and condensation protein B
MTDQPSGAGPENEAPQDVLALQQAVSASCLALTAQLEALLFVAPSPTPITRFAQVLGVEAEAVQAALAELSETYSSSRRGLRVVRKGDRVHLTTAPEAASLIEKFLGLDLTTRLSGAALETLAVIAYRQPLTRGDIESIRGVNCDGVLRTLMARELIEPVGRLEQPGRPFLYGTTLQFLQYFGLEGLDHLPPLPPPGTADSPNVSRATAILHGPA